MILLRKVAKPGRAATREGETVAATPGAWATSTRFPLLPDPIEIPTILRVIPINQLKLEGFPRENREKNSGITGAKQRKNSEKRDVCTLLMLQPKASLEPLPLLWERIENFQGARELFGRYRGQNAVSGPR